MRFAVLLATFLAAPAIAAPVPLPQDIATAHVLAREAAPEPAWGLLTAVTRFTTRLRPKPKAIKGAPAAAPKGVTSPGSPTSPRIKLNRPVAGARTTVINAKGARVPAPPGGMRLDQARWSPPNSPPRTNVNRPVVGAPLRPPPKVKVD